MRNDHDDLDDDLDDLDDLDDDDDDDDDDTTTMVKGAYRPRLSTGHTSTLSRTRTLRGRPSAA